MTAPSAESETSRVFEFQMTSPSGTPTARAMQIRQCFAPSMRVSSMSWSAGSPNYLTVTTGQPHYRKANDWVVISGAALYAGGLDKVNGTYQVQSAGLSSNSFRISYPDADPGQIKGEMWLDRRLIYGVRISAISLNTSTHMATVTTYAPHNLKPGEYFMMNGFESSDSGGAGAIKFNGYFAVASVLSRVVFTIANISSGAAQPNNYSIAGLGLYFQGISTHALPESGMERNRITNIQTAGDYHDTFPGAGPCVRKNYYYNVYKGVVNVLGGPDDNKQGYRLGKVTSSILTEILITADADPNALGAIFESGMVMWLREEANEAAPAYYTKLTSDIIVIPQPNPNPPIYQFKVSVSGYDDQGNPVTLAYADNFRLRFSAVTQINRAVIEDNIFDLTPIPLPAAYPWGDPPRAISLEFGRPIPYRVIQQAVIRRNLIRNVDNETDPNSQNNKISLRLTNCKDAIVTDNILNKMPGPNSSLWTFSAARFDNIHTFNNQREDGSKVRMDNIGVGPIADLSDDAEAWLLGI